MIIKQICIYSVSQDIETAAAIGSKSYNTIVAELVAFETGKAEENKQAEEEDIVDFAAATTAALGVPSPSLARGRSFDDNPLSDPAEEKRRRGDLEEEEELMRALDLSKAECSDPVNVSATPIPNDSVQILDETVHIQSSEMGNGDEAAGLYKSSFSAPKGGNEFGCNIMDNSRLSKLNAANNSSKTESEGIKEISIANDAVDGPDESFTTNKPLEVNSSVKETCTEDFLASQMHHKPSDNVIGGDSTILSDQAASDAPCTDSNYSNGKDEPSDASEAVTSSLEGGEPIYQGEEFILDSKFPAFENQEPIYEGEMVLAEQVEKPEKDSSPRPEDEVALQQCKGLHRFEL